MSRRPYGWIGTSTGVEATDGLLLVSRGHAEKGFPYTPYSPYTAESVVALSQRRSPAITMPC